MVRISFSLLVVASLIAAGCVEETAPGPQVAGPTDLLADGGGAVSGIVVNEETAPLSGALVALGALPPTTTDDGGRFSFRGVEPGRYDLQVQALGYTSIARSVEVADGEVLDIILTLAVIPVAEPRIEVIILKGFSICDYMVWIISGRLPAQACNAQDAKTQFPIIVNETWQFLVAEMKWQGGFANSDTFRMFTADDGDCVSGSPCYGLKYGRGYIKIEGEPGDTDLVKHYDPWTDDRGPGYPDNANGTFEMFLNAQWIGAFASELGSNPACQTVLQYAAGSGYKEGCLGTGVSTGIAFDAYVSIFHLMQPDPRGPCCPATTYSAIPDG